MNDAPEQITREEAQAQIDGLLVAEILRDFASNFKGDYHGSVLARGVGPEQSMIGLAIKRGHLMVASPAALAKSDTVRALVKADADLLLDAYKALLVLHRVLDKAGLNVGAETASNIADRIVAAHPEIPARSALRTAAIRAEVPK